MLPDIDSIVQVYDAVRACLERANLSGYLEPRAHVAEVERLRCLYRPDGDVQLLVIGESHVRVSEEYFGRGGPAFIYNERYYTPWWRHLFLPAFAPETKQADAGVRLQLLREMQSRGIWVVDASLVSLSGYRKVEPGWSNRPFDSIRKALLQISWDGHVGLQVARVLKQKRAPVVCALGSVTDFLPEPVRRDVVRLNCFGPANAAVYGREDYDFGTQAFVRAVRSAEI